MIDVNFSDADAQKGQKCSLSSGLELLTPPYHEKKYPPPAGFEPGTSPREVGCPTPRLSLNGGGADVILSDGKTTKQLTDRDFAFTRTSYDNKEGTMVVDLTIKNGN